MRKVQVQSENASIPMYFYISLAFFLCCLVVLILLVSNAQLLSTFGLIEPVYYVVLVFMGVSAARCLFGGSSSATYKGNVLGGTRRLGGAVVGAALVVFGGYFFVPKESTFPLTVLVHGEGGPQDIVLRNSGRVVLTLGAEARRESIGDNGQAYFPQVPSVFRGQWVPAWVESEVYESVDANIKRRLDGPTLYLRVRKRINHYKLAGTISDVAGNPIPGVRVALPEYHVENKSNSDGRFELEVRDEQQHTVSLIAQKQGYQTARLSPTLGDPELNFLLKRNP